MQENKNASIFEKFFGPLTILKAIYIIVFVGIIVFFNVLFNGFVLDDKGYIIFDSAVHNLNLFVLFGNNVLPGTGEYHPIAAVYFATLYAFFNSNPFFYHFFQVLLQISNSILVFILFQKFFSKKISLFLSLIFLVHPIQAEMASYVILSGDQLCFILGISSLLIATSIGKLNFKKVTLIFSLLLLSLLSKEAGILFLIMVLIYVLMYRKEYIRIFSIYTFPSLCIYLFLRLFYAGTYISKTLSVPIANLPLSGRVLNIPAIFFYYIKTLFFPLYLSINQFWIIKVADFNNFYLPLFWDLLFFLLVMLIGTYIFKKNKKAFALFIFFFVWFVVGIGMYMQIIPLDQTVAAHYFYFPMVGLLGIAGLLFSNIPVAFYKNKITIIYPALIILLIILAVRTMIRNVNWYDDITLLTHDSKIQDNFIIENDLGAEYALRGDYNDSLKHYLKSVSMFAYDDNLHDISIIYEEMGNVEKAKEYYSISYNQKYSMPLPHRRNVIMYTDFGKFLLSYDSPVAAKNLIEQGLNDYPDNGLLWSLLALSEYKSHDLKGALIAAEKAKLLSPNTETNFIYSQILDKQPIKINRTNGSSFLISP